MRALAHIFECLVHSGGNVCKGLGGVALWEEVGPWGWPLRLQKSGGISSLSLPDGCRSGCEFWAVLLL